MSSPSGLHIASFTDRRVSVQLTLARFGIKTPKRSNSLTGKLLLLLFHSNSKAGGDVILFGLKLSKSKRDG